MTVGIIVLLAVAVPTLFHIVRLSADARQRLARIEERLTRFEEVAGRKD